MYIYMRRINIHIKYQLEYFVKYFLFSMTVS